jgi:hypothetical protein
MNVIGGPFLTPLKDQSTLELCRDDRLLLRTATDTGPLNGGGHSTSDPAAANLRKETP